MPQGPCADLQAALLELDAEIAALTELLSDGQLTPQQHGEIDAMLVAARARREALGQQLDQCLTKPIVLLGVERTQANQYFLVNGQGTGAAPDNSVPMIALRPVDLRVYVVSQHATELPTASGARPEVVTGRISYRCVDTPQQSFPDLLPLNGPIEVRPLPDLDRSDSSQTLNFRVPGWTCTGTLEFTVEIFALPPLVAGGAIAMSAPLDSATFVVSFLPVAPFRMHLVGIHYTGPDASGTTTLDIPAPSVFDILATLDSVARTYPVGRIEFCACDELEWDRSFLIDGGLVSFGELLDTLVMIDMADRPADIVIGLVPASVPHAQVLGVGGNGAAVGFVGEGRVMAQEIGHAFGRLHAPCGNPPYPDPDYPNYPPYPSASIGEVGFDPSSESAFDPARTFDFMGYCTPAWVSPYTYAALIGAMQARLAARGISAAGEPATARERLHLNVHVRPDGVHVPPAFHWTDEPRVGSGQWLPVNVELFDANGGLLVSHRCRLSDASQDPDGRWLDLREEIPWFPKVASITIVREGKTIHTIEVEQVAPTVEVNEPAPDGRMVELVWRGTHPDRSLTYLVEYSNDDGEAWRAIAPPQTESRLTIDSGRLAGGERCRFRVLATSGVRTSAGVSPTFALERKPRRALIAAPRDGASLRAGAPLALLGGAFSPDCGLAPDRQVVWTSSVDGVLGRGHRLLVPALSPGPHQLRVTVPDGAGGIASANVSVEAEALDRSLAPGRAETGR
jgi:hypothetical protein